MDPLQHVRWFRGAAPYINAHRQRTFVLMLGGEAIAHANFENVVHDVALLRSLGVRLVIVFGARPQIDAELAAAGIERRYHAGLRITDEAGVGVARRVVGELRMHIEALLSMGLPGTPMAASRLTVTAGNFVQARPLGVVDGIDYVFTGEVRRIDADALTAQLDAECMPLLGPVGYSPSGEVFNLAYEEVAARAAAALGADKLIAFDRDSGLRDETGTLISELGPTELARWVAQQDDSEPERLRTANALLLAVRSGVRRGHVVSHADDGALLTELFSRDGCGTQVTEHSAETLRTGRIEDVPGIIELTAPLEAEGLLLPRSRERVEREIDTFQVVDLDGMVIACAALQRLDDESAEIACVATHPDYRGRDHAERLVEQLERSARRIGYRRLFALTTRAAHWFEEQGFARSTPEQLPPARASAWTESRNSIVLRKDLD